MTTAPAATDPRTIATQALTYYESADPKTISRRDTMTGESYSVLDAASQLAAAVRLLLESQPLTREMTAPEMMSHLQLDYRSSVDDEEAPSWHIRDQHIEREED